MHSQGKMKVVKLPKSPDKSTTKQSIANSLAEVSVGQSLQFQANSPSKSTVPIENITPKRYPLDQMGLIYEGHIINDQPHGQGQLLEKGTQKIVYQGSWLNGARNGTGRYYYPDGSIYEGQWLDNQKNGNGIYSNRAGEFYKGMWKQNRMHGQGELKLSDGISVIGNWDNDQLISGRIMYPNGSSYEGEINRFFRSGKGTYSYPNGDVYKGSWKNNLKDGYGEHYFSKGDTFKGGMNDNQIHGDCFYSWKEGYSMPNGKFNRNQHISGEAIQRDR